MRAVKQRKWLTVLTLTIAGIALSDTASASAASD